MCEREFFFPKGLHHTGFRKLFATSYLSHVKSCKTSSAGKAKEASGVDAIGPEISIGEWERAVNLPDISDDDREL